MIGSKRPLGSLSHNLPRIDDISKLRVVKGEAQISVPKIYETVYVMALRELMTNNIERLSSTAIQNEIIRIAEAIAKLSADKFQQREK